MTASTLWLPSYLNFSKEEILLDAQLTYVLDAQNIFSENAALGQSNEYMMQYFGTVNGVFRIWPATFVGEGDKEGITASYDPRFRPW